MKRAFRTTLLVLFRALCIDMSPEELELMKRHLRKQGRWRRLVSTHNNIVAEVLTLCTRMRSLLDIFEHLPKITAEHEIVGFNAYGGKHEVLCKQLVIRISHLVTFRSYSTREYPKISRSLVQCSTGCLRIYRILLAV